MKFNPIPLMIFVFLIVGLVWSGGHVAWLIVAGVYLLLMILTAAVADVKVTKHRR